MCYAAFLEARACSFIAVREQPTKKFVFSDELQSVLRDDTCRGHSCAWVQHTCASCTLIRISAKKEMATDKLNENKEESTVTGRCGIWNVYQSLSVNNHSIVFLLLNCHISWKSDEFPDMHRLDTDRLSIVFD